MQDLKVTLIQGDMAWENISQNLDHFEYLINSIHKETDLIVLPEMFNTGFSMNVEDLAETPAGPTVQWLKSQAGKKKAVIVTSLMIREDDHYYNRLFWIEPDGSILYYDKRHLFRMAGEHTVYSSGNKILSVKLNSWNISPFVCYDLRFPVWTRNVDNAYDVAVFIANWPGRRSDHWRTLLKARAIENQAYVVGVNRVGMDGNQIRYSGDTSVFDPRGRELFYQADTETVTTVNLDYSALIRYRDVFPVWRDGDRFSINNNSSE